MLPMPLPRRHWQLLVMWMMLGRLGVYGLILGRLPLRVFSIGKYAFQKKDVDDAAPLVTAAREGRLAATWAETPEAARA